MRRLYSSFANGAPGAGLLLMRLAAGCSLAVHATGAFAAGTVDGSTAFAIVSLATSLLLLLGLWTPVAGVLAALAATWHGLSTPSSLGFDILLGLLGFALALLGPGAWSVDARLFGWRRLEIRNGTATDSASGKSRADSSSG